MANKPDRTREIRPSGIEEGACGNVGYGSQVALLMSVFSIQGGSNPGMVDSQVSSPLATTGR